jgi:hypothetical protein
VISVISVIPATGRNMYAPDIDRPAKRPRLSYTPDDSEDVPEEFDLPAARAQNDQRLKSLFEGIFAKYSQDFTDVGDEIDLQSGKLVVDNGHLLGMQGERDTGVESHGVKLVTTRTPLQKQMKAQKEMTIMNTHSPTVVIC